MQQNCIIGQTQFKLLDRSADKRKERERRRKKGKGKEEEVIEGFRAPLFAPSPFSFKLPPPCNSSL